MTCIHRITYAGVCEIWVESDGHTITKLLSASPSGELIGKQIDDLPDPNSVEAKLMAETD